MKKQALNEYWKTVVDTIQEGVMIVAPGGVIVSANRAFLQLTGYEIDELIGQPCSSLNCTACHLERKRENHHWCRLFREGYLKKQRCVLTRRDGSKVHIFKNASVLKNSSGKVIGAVETMTDITELLEKETKIEAFKRELSGRDTFHGMIGVSSVMQRVFNLVNNAADSDAPVIIYGESGTGKELIAHAVHEISNRRDFPYIKVNCAALNESLLESELFGHIKGAFTTAIQDRKGRFEAADRGCIFLDEIGDLPLATQVKLLRVLEEKIIERVGDNSPIPINVRIISATNKDLMQMVREGEFREDFFYRINVIPIHIPPVRERNGDIALLAESFFRQLQLKTEKNIKRISKRAMNLLLQYNWPGNVRELRSTFEYAFVTCQGAAIRSEDLPPVIQNYKNRAKESRSVEPILSDKKQRQKQELMDALDAAGGNQSQAADILGVSRVTVWNRMKKFGIHYEKKVWQKQNS
ncbi:MAG: sigma 54-interacting transcriptional regulator [Deltaproteobacteria bacterium]|nr:sigma 54-interacting transcriptional regulator [Deltaproteobacteria bacterium]